MFSFQGLKLKMADPESTVINTSVKQVRHLDLLDLSSVFNALLLPDSCLSNPSCIMIFNTIFTCLYPFQLCQLFTLPNICPVVMVRLMYVAINDIVFSYCSTAQTILIFIGGGCVRVCM